MQDYTLLSKLLPYIAIFENGCCTPQWDYREVLEDGRDWTVGVCGFTDEEFPQLKDGKFHPTQEQQLAKAQREFLDPVIPIARQYNIKTLLGFLILFDTAIQHGMGDDPDALPAIIKLSKIKKEMAEKNKLSMILKVRRAVLSNPHNKETTVVWRESIPRVSVLEHALGLSDFQLMTPISTYLNYWDSIT
jgi:Glycosyl hydrolase family 46